ncbi:hypothetical protein BFR04_15585 [Gaetbulibacter sp. 4G1]|nr:hypothetical protein BFR04_15585 [Gaetbulibacter sp. 4G1]
MKVKPKRTFGWYFIRVLILTSIFLFFYLSFIKEHTWSLNKTVGWAWDITNINFWLGIIFTITLFLFIVVLISFLLKKLIDVFAK